MQTQNDARPKVSVIIPVYNVERYLDRCVRSVLGQTLREIEVILVDDGSPDGCPAMCDAYAREDSRVRVVHKANAGLGMARNSGLDIAVGEYVAFVDSDDFIDRRMYETLYLKAKTEKCDTVLCNCCFYTSGNCKERRDVDRETLFSGREEVDGFLLDVVGPLPQYNHDVKYMMSVWHAIYSMELIEKWSLRFVSEREFMSEDIIWDIGYFSKAERIVYIPDVFYFYCFNGESLTRKYNPDKYEKNKKLLLEVERRLALLFPASRYEQHYMRLMLMSLRSSLGYAARNNRGTTEIRRILDDCFWSHLLSTYPYGRTDLKHKAFFLLVKLKLVSLIKVLLG